MPTPTTLPAPCLHTLATVSGARVCRLKRGRGYLAEPSNRVWGKCVSPSSCASRQKRFDRSPLAIVDVGVGHGLHRQGVYLAEPSNRVWVGLSRLVGLSRPDGLSRLGGLSRPDGLSRLG